MEFVVRQEEYAKGNEYAPPEEDEEESLDLIDPDEGLPGSPEETESSPDGSPEHQGHGQGKKKKKKKHGHGGASGQGSPDSSPDDDSHGTKAVKARSSMSAAGLKNFVIPPAEVAA